MSRRRFKLIAAVLLVALGFRAYVPAGFMPASGRAFALDICYGDAAARLPASGAHRSAAAHRSDGATPDPAGTHHGADACPFGSVPSAGPLPGFALLHAPSPPAATPAAAASSALIDEIFDRAHRARAPPRNA